MRRQPLRYHQPRLEELEARRLLSGSHDRELLAALDAELAPANPQGFSHWSHGFSDTAIVGRKLPLLGDQLKSQFSTRPLLNTLLSRVDRSATTFAQFVAALDAVSGVTVRAARDQVDQLEVDLRLQQATDLSIPLLQEFGGIDLVLPAMQSVRAAIDFRITVGAYWDSNSGQAVSYLRTDNEQLDVRITGSGISLKGDARLGFTAISVSQPTISLDTTFRIDLTDAGGQAADQRLTAAERAANSITSIASAGVHAAVGPALAFQLTSSLVGGAPQNLSIQWPDVSDVTRVTSNLSQLGVLNKLAQLQPSVLTAGLGSFADWNKLLEDESFLGRKLPLVGDQLTTVVDMGAYVRTKFVDRVGSYKTAQELKNRLAAVSDLSNVSVSLEGDDLRFTVHVDSQFAKPVQFDLGLGSRLDLHLDIPNLRLAARLQGDVVFGVDMTNPQSALFYVDSQTASPELVVDAWLSFAGVDATGRSGFLSVDVTKGSADLQARVEIDLTSADGRITSNEMAQGAANLGSLAAAQWSGNAQATLPLNVPLLSTPTQALQAQWPDLNNLGSVVTNADTFSILSDYRNITAAQFSFGLDQVAMLLSSVASPGLSLADIWQERLPLAGRSVSELIGLPTFFVDAVSSATTTIWDANGQGTLPFHDSSELLTLLRSLPGLENITVDVSATPEDVRYDLRFQRRLSRTLPLTVDIASQVDLDLRGSLTVELTSQVDVTFGVNRTTGDFFILDTSEPFLAVSGSATASIDAAARLGFLDIEVTGATVSLSPSFSLALNDPATDANPSSQGKITISELTGAAGAALVAAQGAGTAELSAPLSSSLIADTATLIVSWPDLSRPDQFQVNTADISAFYRFNDIEPKDVLAGLQALPGLLTGLKDSRALGSNLALIGSNLQTLIGLSDRWQNVLTGLGTPRTAQALQAKLEQQLGLPPGTLPMEVRDSGIEFVLELKQNWADESIEFAVDKGVTIASTDLGFQVSAAATLSGDVAAKMRVGIAFGSQVSPEDRFYLVVGNDSRASISAQATATVNANANLGLLTIGVVNGRAAIAGTSSGQLDENQPASLALELVDPGPRFDGKITLGELTADPLSVLGPITVNGAARAELPLAKLPGMADSADPRITLNWPDLGDVSSVGFELSPDMNDYLSAALDFDITTALGGIDAIISLIRGWAGVELLNTKLPLLNVSARDVFNYIDEGAKFFQAIVSARPTNALQFDQAVLNAVAAAGLDPREVSVTPNSDPALHNPAASRFRYLVDYHFRRTVADLGFDWGGDLLTLDMAFDPQVTFDATLEFGLNKDDGFFLVDQGNQPEIAIGLTLGGDQNVHQIGGHFGPLRYGVSNGTAKAAVTLSVDLVDPNASGSRITASELLGNFTSIVNAQIDGTATVDLPIGVMLGNDGPGVTTRFQAYWDAASPTEFVFGEARSGDPADGFSDLKFEMGDYIRRAIGPVVERVKEYNPLRPELIAELTKKLPLIDKAPLEVLGIPPEIDFLFAIEQIVNSIPTDGRTLDLTPYFGGTPAPNAGSGSATGGTRTDAIDQFLTDLRDTYRITLPIIDSDQDGTFDAGAVIDVMLGKDVKLISWDPPKFERQWTFPDLKVPFVSYGIAGIVELKASAVLGGFISLFGDVEVGLGTRGLLEDRNADGQPDLDLMAGFYIGDNRPNAPSPDPDDWEIGFQAQVQAGIEGAAALFGYDVVQVRGTAGVTGVIGLDLADVAYDSNDPDAIDGMIRVGRNDTGGDDQVYLDELQFVASNYGFQCALTLGGEVDVSASIRAEVDLYLFKVTVFERSVDYPLVKWAIPCGNLAEDDLADIVGSSLVMKADSSADDKRIQVSIVRDAEGNPDRLRISKQTKDNYLFDDFSLVDASDSDYLGGVTSLVLEGSEGNDAFRIDPDVFAVSLLRRSGTGSVPNPVEIREVTVFARGGDDQIDFGRIEQDNTHLVRTILHGGSGDDVLSGTPLPDVIHGGDGNDVIVAYLGADELYGEEGNDILDGGAGDDRIFGGSGADRILGADGQNEIHGGADDDRISGGPDVDRIFGDGGADVVHAGRGDDVVDGGDGRDRLFGGPGRDRLLGGPGDDDLYGDAGADHLEGGEGRDGLYGLDGNDFLFGGSGNDVLRGGGGDDYLEAGSGDDHVFGDEQYDLLVQQSEFDQTLTDTTLSGLGTDEYASVERVRLIGSAGANRFDVSRFHGTAELHGLGGTDTVVSIGDTDFVLADWNLSRSDGASVQLLSIEEARLGGGDRDNRFDVSRWTGAGAVTGGAGQDRIVAQGDTDFTLTDTTLSNSLGLQLGVSDIEVADIAGGPAANTIDASTFTGMVNLQGGPGDDRLLGGTGDDWIDAGPGTDVVLGGAGDDELIGGGGAGDRLEGGEGDDLLRGSHDGPDVLLGGPGQDRLIGSAGNDTLDGGPGRDLIDGGPGDDLLSGGAGSDVLVGGADHDRLYGHRPGGEDDDRAVDYLYGDFGTNGNEAGSGRDRLYGQGGNDLLFGEGDDDAIDAGGGGSDWVDYGGGEGADPADFDPPDGTPNPALDPWSLTRFGPLTLPDAPQEPGRWHELSGSASGRGLSGHPGLSVEPSVAADSQGQYVAWSDNRNGSFEIYVAYHPVGGAWMELASSAHDGGVSDSTDASRRPSLVLDDGGAPIVVWEEIGSAGTDIMAARWNPAEQAWQPLGTSTGAGGISGTGRASRPRIVVTTAGPVVAWLDASTGTSNVYVKRFDGTNWVELGDGSARGDGVSQSGSDIQEFSLASSGDRVAVVWSQPAGQQRQVYLREFDGTGWAELAGSASSTGISASSGNASDPSVAYLQGRPFVAWVDDASGFREIYAARYDGAQWSAAGADANRAGGVSQLQGMSDRPRLASGGGALYLMWVADRAANESANHHALYVKRWNGSAFESELPEDAAGRGIAGPVRPVDTALAVDSHGHPFASWSDESSGNAEIYLRGNSWNVGTIYYVNDDSTDGDRWSTAPGSDEAGYDGLSPSRPLPSVQAVLDTYTLSEGDVILVDSGTYLSGFTVTAADSGFLVLGSADLTARFWGTLTFDQANAVTVQQLDWFGTVSVNGGSGAALRGNRISSGGVKIDGGTHHHVVDNLLRRASTAIEITGNAGGASVWSNDLNDSGTAIAVTGDGAADVEVRDNHVVDAIRGIDLAAAAGGNITGNDVQARVVAMAVGAPFGGSLERNRFHGAATGLEYAAAADVADNWIYENNTGVLATVANPSDALGFAGSGVGNRIFANDVGVQLHGLMRGQYVYENVTGVTGNGVLGGTDFDTANWIERNAVGVDFAGPIQFQRIGRNDVGIVATDQTTISHNLLYRNAIGVRVSGKRDVRLVSNTVYAPHGDAIRLESGARNIEIRNNILWTDDGYAIYVSDDSREGLFSDYNDLYAGGSGKLVHWGVDFSDVLDWQQDVFRYDLHSIGSTVVDAYHARPAFVNRARDDYRIFPPLAQLRMTSPTVDAADPLVDVAVPPTRRNLLANPGFEEGLASWIVEPSGSIRGANPAPHAGSHYFAPGDQSLTTLRQTINLADAGWSAADIDSQRPALLFGGRVRSAAEARLDEGWFEVRFLADNGTLIDQQATSAVRVSDRWELAGKRTVVPVGTRSIEFRFVAQRRTAPGDDVFLDDAFVVLLPSGVGIDLGAYGNTQDDWTDEQGLRVRLRTPDLYRDWVRTQSIPIEWDSFGNTAGSPVRIDLYQDGPDGPAWLQTIADTTEDDGTFAWTAADSGVDFGTYGLRIHVSVVGNAAAWDRSSEPFTVPEDGTMFFVNDRNTDGDSVTSAPGNNRHTGRLASAPKPLPQSILRIYQLGAGQTVQLDAGTYDLFAPLTISHRVGDEGDDEGFRMTGPAGETPLARLRHVFTTTEAPLILLDNADYVTLEHLDVGEGHSGIVARDSSTNLTLRHIAANGNRTDGIRVDSGSTLVEVTDVVANDNGRFGIYVDGTAPIVQGSEASRNGATGFRIAGAVARFVGNRAQDNAGDGVWLDRVGNAVIETNVAIGNSGNGFHISNPPGTVAVVGSSDLTAQRGNIAQDNRGVGIVAIESVRVEGNTSSGNDVGISTSFGASAKRNVVFANRVGISQNRGGALVENRIYGNSDTGIVVNYRAPIDSNVVYSNNRGIWLQFYYAGSVTNNLIYDHRSEGILVQAGANLTYPGGRDADLVDIRNNTFFANRTSGVRVEGLTQNVELTNNIFWSDSGSAISVATDSQHGFVSDYNAFYTTGDGIVAHWAGSEYATLRDWRRNVFQDASSIDQDPWFVDADGADDQLGYQSAQSDGRDDDFHLQSQYGSDHGGSLAPVLDPTSGLPRFVQGTRTLDPQTSPAIDRGDPSDPADAEPLPNGRFVNLGAYGGTSAASLSPSEYLTVVLPASGEVWPAEQTFRIDWRSHDTSGTVDIELIQAGDGTLAQVIADDTENDGAFDWSIPASVPPGEYRVRITRNDGSGIGDESDGAITVTPPVHTYYVNDSTLNPDGDWTTAVGDDANDGVTPATPKASISAILDAYNLDPGDVIRVDAGVYDLSANVVITADDAGVRIEGYHDDRYPDRQALLTRPFYDRTAFVFEFKDADNTIIEYLTLQGGQYAVFAGSDSDSDGLVLRNLTLLSSVASGILLEWGNDNAQVTDNVVRGPSSGFVQRTGINVNAAQALIRGNRVVGCEVGISALSGVGSVVTENVVYANGLGIVVDGLGSPENLSLAYDNEVFGNNYVGIIVRGYAVAENNRVSGQTGSGTGIGIGNAAVARNNVVFDNPLGLNVDGGTAADNRVYGNTTGILVSSGQVASNQVYDNSLGVLMIGSGQVRNNVIYANEQHGIEARQPADGIEIFNNAIFQPQGEAVRIVSRSKNARIHDNIFWTESGAALRVSEDAIVGFQSDYNLFYTEQDAPVAVWEGTVIPSLADWQFDVGYGQHSLNVDPQFVDMDGLDNRLGYSSEPAGNASFVDDADAAFQTLGVWTRETGTGRDGGYVWTAPANGAATAEWTIDNLEPDGFYELAVTWPAQADAATQAEFEVYDGNRLVRVVRANQRQEPADFTDDGNSWKRLGVIATTTDTLRVRLRSNPTGKSLADALRVRQIVGDGGRDDDFHLLPTSPAVDGGSLTGYWLLEPEPNGGRVNMGAFGNTPEAASSPPQLVQVLAPNGPERYRQGESLPIQWRSDGIHQQRVMARINVGGSAVGLWQDNRYQTVGISKTTPREIDTSGVSDPAPQQVYQQYSTNDLFRNNSVEYEIPVPDGEYTVRLHFTSLFRERFDIVLQDEVVESNFDLFLRAGGYGRALAVSYPVTASDGNGIRVKIVKTTSTATLSGIEIIQASPSRNPDPRYTISVSSDDGNTWSTVAQDVPEERPGHGRYEWTIPPDATPTSRYRVRVANNGTGATDQSDQPFLIAEDTPWFYVNDSDQTGDEYTTATGDNRQTGKSPDQPMASIRALLSAYDLGPGDTVYIDTGTYPQRTSLAITQEDAGVTLQGAVDHVTRLDRGNAGHPVVDLQNADGVTLANLEFTGGSAGVYAGPASDSDQVTIIDSRLFGNSTGIHARAGNEQWAIRGNTIYGFPGEKEQEGIIIDAGQAQITDNTVFDNRTGIRSGPENEVLGNRVYTNIVGISLLPQATARGNRVFGNRDSGIVGAADALIEDNEVFGHASGTGIVTAGASASGNRVYGNALGINVNSGAALANTVFSNDVGLQVHQVARGNHVSDNRVGIEIVGDWKYQLNPTPAEVSHNIITDNSQVAIRSNTQKMRSEVDNNTIFQPHGNGLEFAGGPGVLDFENNIISVKEGFAIEGGVAAQLGLHSDYNLFHTTDPAKTASWRDVEVASLHEWNWASGLDSHSIAGDPQFVSPAGPDGILGFDVTAVGPPVIIDNTDSRFAATGNWQVDESGGYGGSHVYHESGADAAQAVWQFDSVLPGYYQVLVTYPAHTQASTRSPVSIYDGNSLAYRRRVDQRGAADDVTVDGADWLSLGYFEITSGTLRVELDSNVPSGRLTADAVRIQQVAGWGGDDDDFHVQSGSPAVDRGNPDDYMQLEPFPNGDRINVGAYGNTPQATASPPYSAQLLTLQGWDKVQVDRPVDVAFRTSGVASRRMVARINVGGERVGSWGPDKFLVQGYPFYDSTSSHLVLPPDAAPEEVYRSYITHATVKYEIPVSPGTYDVRLSFYERSPLGPGERPFDIYVQDQLVQSNYDIVADAGGSRIVVRRTYRATVEDSQSIRIRLEAKGSRGPVLSAIELLADNPAPVDQATASLLVSTDDGNTWETVAQAVPIGPTGTGTAQWTPTVPTDANTARARLVIDSSPQATDTSREAFLIGPAGNHFYVNDVVTDEDEWATSDGDNRFSGKSPDRPLRSLPVLLDAYDLEPGDIVHVDHGVYTLRRNVVAGADDAGVTIEGPRNGTARLDRLDAAEGYYLSSTLSDNFTYAFGAVDTEGVTVRRLELVNGRVGWLAEDSVGATLEQSRVLGNQLADAWVASSSRDTRITDSEFDGSGGGFDWSAPTGIYDNGYGAVFAGNFFHDYRRYGIEARGTAARIERNELLRNGTGVLAMPDRPVPCTVIRDNLVHDNTSEGLYGSQSSIVGNQVFRQNIGIVSRGSPDCSVERNVVYENRIGMRVSGPVRNNEVFENTETGILLEQVATVDGNRIYSNATGLVVPTNIRARSMLANNLIYANTERGIQVGTWTRLLNNTVYQPVGDAIRVDVLRQTTTEHTLLRNNIISVGAGFGIWVSDRSRSSTDSDWNLFDISDDPNAHLGYWGGNQEVLADWQAATGGDANSLSADPQFVDIDGADNVLGGVDGGFDDNFHLGKQSPAIDRAIGWYATDEDGERLARHDDPGSDNLGGLELLAPATQANAFAEIGTAQNWRGTNKIWELTLPFEFPFYGQTYSRVFVASNGVLYLTDSTPYPSYNSQTVLMISSAIAPLWDYSLTTETTEGDIYVDVSSADQVTIRWDATNATDGSDVNFSATLFRSGDVRFDYGPGNTNLQPTVGVSAGTGITAVIAPYDGQSTLTNAESLFFQYGRGFRDLGAFEFQGSSLDFTPPRVLDAFLVKSVLPPQTELHIEFSEPLDTIDARAASNYELRGAGPNQTLGDSDDVIYDVRPRYDAGATRVVLDVDDASAPLTGGQFQLTVRGSTTIHDLSANPLDGDGDGTAGGDYVVSNHAPQLTVGGDRIVNEKETVEFDASANDPDGDTLTFSLDASAPAGATIDPSSGHFRWTPDEEDGPGVYPVAIRVQDDGSPALMDWKIVTITVREVNDPPKLDAIEDQLVRAGTRLDVTATASDPEHGRLTFSLVGTVPAGATIDAATGRFSWTPGEELVGRSFDITVKVTDDGTPPQSDTTTFNILVTGESTTPWQNPRHRADINADGMVTPLDALTVIEALLETGARNLPVPPRPPEVPPPYLDASGDNILSPIDALTVIYALLDGSEGEGEAGEWPAAPPAASTSPPTAPASLPRLCEPAVDEVLTRLEGILADNARSREGADRAGMSPIGVDQDRWWEHIDTP